MCASVALDECDLHGTIIHQRAPHFPRFLRVVDKVAIQSVRRWPLCDYQSHGFLLCEVSLDAEYSGGKQTSLVVEYRIVGSLVDVESTVRCQAVQ